MLLIFFFSGIVSCHPPPAPSTVEVPASSKGCQRAFVEEHDSLFQENIRLKAALKDVGRVLEVLLEKL